jgi:hypothetical protein
MVCLCTIKQMIQKNEEFGAFEKNWQDSEKTKPEPEPHRTLECFQNRLYTFHKCLENHLDVQLCLSSVKQSRTQTRTRTVRSERRMEVRVRCMPTSQIY